MQRRSIMILQDLRSTTEWDLHDGVALLVPRGGKGHLIELSTTVERKGREARKEVGGRISLRNTGVWNWITKGVWLGITLLLVRTSLSSAAPTNYIFNPDYPITSISPIPQKH